MHSKHINSSIINDALSSLPSDGSNSPSDLAASIVASTAQPDARQIHQIHSAIVRPDGSKPVTLEDAARYVIVLPAKQRAKPEWEAWPELLHKAE